jgi:hypothetical protein
MMRLTRLKAALFAASAIALGSCMSEQITGPSSEPALRTDVTATAGPVIVINEILADPSAVADASGEWFEIHNAGDAPQDLIGW